MNDKLKYEQSHYKTDGNQLWWKTLRDENFKMIYTEFNCPNIIKFWI